MIGAKKRKAARSGRENGPESGCFVPRRDTEQIHKKEGSGPPFLRSALEKSGKNDILSLTCIL